MGVLGATGIRVRLGGWTEYGSARIERFLICEPEVPPTFPQALCERVAILFGDITQPFEFLVISNSERLVQYVIDGVSE